MKAPPLFAAFHRATHFPTYAREFTHEVLASSFPRSQSRGMPRKMSSTSLPFHHPSPSSFHPLVAPFGVIELHSSQLHRNGNVCHRRGTADDTVVVNGGRKLSLKIRTHCERSKWEQIRDRRGSRGTSERHLRETPERAREENVFSDVLTTRIIQVGSPISRRNIIRLTMSS